MHVLFSGDSTVTGKTTDGKSNDLREFPEFFQRRSSFRLLLP